MRTGESILPRQEAALAAAVPVAAVTVPFVTDPADVICAVAQDTYIIMLLENITETVPVATHQAGVFTAGNFLPKGWKNHSKQEKVRKSLGDLLPGIC